MFYNQLVMVRLSPKNCNLVLCLLIALVVISFYLYVVKNGYKPYKFSQQSGIEAYEYIEEELGTLLEKAKIKKKIKAEENPPKIGSFSLQLRNQEDPELVDYLRSKLVPPAPKDQKYFLKLNEYDTSQGQAQLVRQLLRYKRNGFFVECGGGDGEFYSNTLFMEQHLNWTGLLVEADPIHAKKLLTVHRKAWFSPFCLSLNTSAYRTYFKSEPSIIPIWGRVQDYPGDNTVEVTCVPFYTHMLALNVTKVDYFSLDVEGHEVEVLETVPFDKIDIDILSVEFNKAKGGKLGLIDTMGKKGYRVVKEIGEDIMFVKNNFNVRFVV